MKITIIGTAHPYRGGLAAFNERLANEFIVQGHEVEIYTFTLQYPSFLFPGTTQYSDEPAPANLKIKRKINSVNPLNWLFTGWKIRRTKPDVAIVPFWLPFMAPCLGTIARIIRGNKKTKLVSIVHNMLPHEAHLSDKILSRYFVHSVDKFVTLSKSVFADIDLFDKNGTKEKIFSPHPLYDHFGEKISRGEALAQLGLNPAERYMLFFGFIRHYKGLDLLMDAFSDERFKKLNVKLIVAGEFYSNENFYFNLEKKTGLEGKIIWANSFIPDSEVRRYFCAADIVVQPYKTATQSGVTQIAYHFEKPMLVTNVGGLPEIVPDGKVGYAVEPMERAIADALVDFFENGRNFDENIKAEKEKYSWGKMVGAVV